MAVTDSMFLLAESREHPTHVAGLQLFRPPEGAEPQYVSELYRELLSQTEVSRTMRQRAYRSPTTLGQWAWKDDPDVELDYHVRLSALPRPGRVRELLELVSRLHGSLLDRHRPLWEFHLVEGLVDGRFATYTKVHHALMDGVTAVRWMSRGMSTSPTAAAVAPWAPSPDRDGRESDGGPLGAAKAMVKAAVEIAGTPQAVTKALLEIARDSGVTGPFNAPPTMFNVPIGGARRFAGQSWPLSRVRGVASAAGVTVNDVAVAMCSGALRRYLLDQNALPDRPLVAMLPISLRAAGADVGGGGNAVGAMLCDLGTDETDPGARLARVSASTRGAKAMLKEMSPSQVLAVSALMAGGLVLAPIPGIGPHTPPPFNLIISNVPGSREVKYWNGAELVESYPLSIPTDGQAINITLTSYVDSLAFGIVGCRRSVPHLQRLLDHLGTELDALERAVGARSA